MTSFLIITGLLLLNAFFVVAEFALVKAPQSALSG